MLPESDDDLSGFFFREGERRVIGVNSTHPSVRQRFTIAHELGWGPFGYVDGAANI